jgi:hypothetical protein
LQYSKSAAPPLVRTAALEGLGRGWHDEATMEVIREIAGGKQENFFVWQKAQTLAGLW